MRNRWHGPAPAFRDQQAGIWGPGRFLLARVGPEPRLIGSWAVVPSEESRPAQRTRLCCTSSQPLMASVNSPLPRLTKFWEGRSGASCVLPFLFHLKGSQSVHYLWTARWGCALGAGVSCKEDWRMIPGNKMELPWNTKVLLIFLYWQTWLIK